MNQRKMPDLMEMELFCEVIFFLSNFLFLTQSLVPPPSLGAETGNDSKATAEAPAGLDGAVGEKHCGG